MKLVFKIHYHTRWGESLWVVLNHDVCGASPMDHLGNGWWEWECDMQRRDVATLQYGYMLQLPDGNKVVEPLALRNITTLSHSAHTLVCHDAWQTNPLNKPLYSSALEGNIRRHQMEDALTLHASKVLTLSMHLPYVGRSQRLVLVGAHPLLGGWQEQAALPCQYLGNALWAVSIDLGQCTTSFAYKFALQNVHSLRIEQWEDGDNRYFDPTQQPDGEQWCVSGLQFRATFAPWRGAGVAIPVFSLRTRQSFGVGDFSDIKHMVDWAAYTKQKVVQILPINDTCMTKTNKDSYPYNAISMYALHPIYLSLHNLPAPQDGQLVKIYKQRQKELNELPQIDYEKVLHAKLHYAQSLYSQEGEKILTSSAFVDFYQANQTWLLPYAAFSFLRDKYHSVDAAQWGLYAHYDADAVRTLCETEHQAVGFYYYLQYYLHIQLIEAATYARSNGVVLKGDIPIGISRNSVEAWVEPHLFNLLSNAGAPPDAFAVKGQNWSFPTYNWDEMAKDDYAWWKKRFGHIAQYFDAYRIDHILGFFRIWQIPSHAIDGLLGAFNPSLPLTADEIRSFGLGFDPAWHARVHIHENTFREIFGESADVLQHLLFDTEPGGFLTPKSIADTQIKMTAWADTNTMVAAAQPALNDLLTQVLFVSDEHRPGYYHPRVTAATTLAYSRLHWHEQQAFDRLYEHYYYHRHNEFWRHNALKKLPQLLDATGMLVCGEDLGMIPECVPQVMQQLQILSLEVQRMSKDTRVEFGWPPSYPYDSVCTTGTHDTSTLRAWWEEDRAQTQRYYNTVLHEGGEAPWFCEPWICEKIIAMHLHAPSMLAVLPWQDWVAMDGSVRADNPQSERINVPANPDNYWGYRMHICLEDLLEMHELNNKITRMIKQSGRDME